MAEPLPALSDESSADGPAAPVVVQRWKRFGHDRAYVHAGGIQLGYRNLKTSEIDCEKDEYRCTIDQATLHLLPPREVEPPEPAPDQGGYLPRHARSDEPSAPAVEQLPVAAAVAAPARRPQPAKRVSAVPLLPDRDLASNAPGSASRVQAMALRDAAPVRTLLARVAGVKTDERAWRIGADAEIAVARLLSALGAEWPVLHAVPVGANGSDIDHVVIGPAGVFTINTKHHPDAAVWVRADTFKVNGQNQHYVRNSRHEAQRAARLLSNRAQFEVDVRALIVVVGATGGFTVKEQPKDGSVTVLTHKSVESHLRLLPAVLDTPSVLSIFEVARHLATWQPSIVEWAPEL